MRKYINGHIPNKNYVALYFNTIGIKFASSLVLSFVGAYLYFEGVSLPLIFVYFGGEFFLRGLFSPLSGVITTRFGYARAVVIGNILLAAYFLTLSALPKYPLIGFSSFILHAMSRGIYYPTKHYMEAKFVQEFNRGRFLTLEIVIASITGALAVLFATYSVTVWKSFLPVALAVSLFLLFSSISVSFMLGDLPFKQRIRYRDTFQRCLSPIFRKDATAFIGFGMNMMFNNVVVTLLVFFVVGSLKLFGLVIATVFVLEMLVIFIYGSLIDRNRLRSNKAASVMQIVSYGSFLAATTPLLVATVKTFYDVVWNVFDSSFTTRFHSKISRKGLVYACAKEVSLDMTSAAMCFVLAAAAFLWAASTTFYLALALAAAGVVLAWTQFKD